MYKLAADQGHAGAQFGLGLMYANGRGVPEEIARGTGGAAGGKPGTCRGAQTNLGAMYAKGRVAQDYKEAFKWYKLAADQGHAGAQFGLGLMYAKGQGVVQNYKKAFKRFKLTRQTRGMLMLRIILV